MPSSTKPASVQVDRIQTKVVSFGCTPSTHLVKMFNSFLTMPMHPLSTAFTSGDGISLTTPQATFMGTFCIHANQAIPCRTN
jgi:hypothetical protein